MTIKRLKVDFHLHTGDDPLDSIKYSSKQLIDSACAEGFDVISITNHHVVTYNQYLTDYAKERGILLIPGIELSVKSKHVLIINADKSASRIKTFTDLRKYKNKNSLIIAPHPFFPGSASLHSKFALHYDLFNAIEYSYFHSNGVNFNMKGIYKAIEHGLPLIGTSDSHRLWQLGKTYSLVKAEKSTEAVLDAINRNHIEVISEPLELLQMTKIGLRLLSDFNGNLMKYLPYPLSGNNGKGKRAHRHFSYKKKVTPIKT